MRKISKHRTPMANTLWCMNEYAPYSFNTIYMQARTRMSLKENKIYMYISFPKRWIRTISHATVEHILWLINTTRNGNYNCSNQNDVTRNGEYSGRFIVRLKLNNSHSDTINHARKRMALSLYRRHVYLRSNALSSRLH